jgi:hypothetical protein
MKNANVFVDVIIIDDMPSTVLNPFVFNVHAEPSWESMVNTILQKHIN